MVGSLSLTIIGPTVRAQPASGPTGPEIVSTRTTVAHRVEASRTERPPVIDGRLGDAAWNDAILIDNLRQVEPVENGEPSERTEVRILYDADFLYIAFRCFDREPSGIIATEMRRDGAASSGGRGFGNGGTNFRDDRVMVVLDTFHDRRNGFYFEINPVGARTDGLIENNDDLRTDWDGIWYGKASIDDAGWAAEIAIPFKTVGFNERSDTWGLNLQRSIRRRNEDIRWSAPQQNKELTSVADAGELTGLMGLNQGIGLDVVPFGVASYLRDHNENDEDWDLDAGFDLFYNFTPSLKAAITVNTDFAETEVDERQVNLTRFPLFFPEKRDFFLQDAGIFNFGGIRMNPLPFHSRRIGIGADGEEVDIIAGAKITGRIGDLNLGLLDVQTDDHAGVNGSNLAVGRVSYNVLSESDVGVIGTYGDPRSNGSNALYGFDFNFRDSQFSGDQTATGHAWILQSNTPGVDGGETAWGLKAGWPNDIVDWEVGFTHIDQDFNPALGFVPRGGIREYYTQFRYRWRPGGVIRRIDVGTFATLITDLDNDLESSEINLNLLSIETEYGDEFDVEYSIVKEVLDEDFEISEGVVIPVGSYDWQRTGVAYSGSQARLLRFEADASYGGFWSGESLELQAGVEWRASANLSLSLEYEYNDVDLDEGDFITRLARARANIYFTPDISWQTFIQYDNVSDTLGINSRFHWIIQPGSDFYLVLNQGYDIIDSRPHSGFTELTSKVGWTFRF
jgi:hypothetical protein